MSDSTVTIIGSNSAISVHNRFPSSQLIKVENDHILIDCGEGTQFRMSEHKIKKSKISTILISHLHGDHVFGLPGLLTSFQLSGRTKKLTVYGPAPIKNFLKVTIGETGHFISYPLEIIEVDVKTIRKKQLSLLCSLNDCEVFSFELIHRIDCIGFLIREKSKKPNIDPDFLRKYQPHFEDLKKIKKGEDYVDEEGLVIPNEQCVLPISAPRSYAYCSDTRYHPKLSEILTKVSTIYHESTYLEDYKDKAAERFHSTAKQAASIAKSTGSSKLILGHFSSKYKDLQPFVDEAKTIFDNVYLAIEGKTFDI